MVVISLINNKGGCSKTSSTFQLTYGLANMGKKCLMIDNDSQSSLTIYAGIEPLDLKYSMYDVITSKCDINDTILKTDNPNVDILPASIDLSGGEIEIISVFGRETILRDKISQIKELYDFILIDNSPSLGTLTVNSIIASDFLIAPTEPSYLAFRGIEILMSTVGSLKRLNPKLEFMGILVSLYDKRINHHKEILAEYRKKYPVFQSVINRSSKFAYACLACKSIYEYAGDKFIGSIQYSNLCNEVLEYVK